MPDSMHQLLREIEAKDRRFRVAQAMFMCLLGLGILAVLFVQYLQFVEFRTQSTERQKAIIKVENHNDQQLAQQTRYIQCLAQFFATKDRATRILTDLDKCTIMKDGSTVNGVDLNPTIVPVDNSGNTNPAPAGSTQNTPVKSPSTTPPPTTTPTAQPDPVKVLGIPVCVPLTHVCVRQ